MSKVVTKRGHADWADLTGKRIEFKWYDGYEDYPYHYDMTFSHTQSYAEDPRYPRYYVLDEDGGGVSFWEDQAVEVTVHD